MPSRHFAHLLSASALALTLQAATNWTDPHAGLPVVEAHTVREVGHSLEVWHLTQDTVTNRILVGTAAKLLSFDGSRWQEHALPAHFGYPKPLLGDREGRIWVIEGGGHIGYLRPSANGAYRFEDLSDKFATLELENEAGWGACEIDGRVFIITTRLVLSWDGVTARYWKHPSGSQRLFPFQFEGATWFHQISTGLFRIEADGPKLVFPADQLPSDPIMALHRERDGLWALNRKGFFAVGSPTTNRTTEALVDFFSNNRLGDVVVLPDDLFAAATFGGVAIFDAAGQLLRRIDSRDGLPSSSVYSLRMDRQGYLWAGTTAGVAAFSLSTSTTLVPFEGVPGGRRYVSALTFDHERRLIASSDERPYGLSSQREPLRPAFLHPLPDVASRTMGLQEHPTGLFMIGFREVILRTPNGIEKSGDTERSGFYLAPSRRDPSSVLAVFDSVISAVSHNAEGKLAPVDFVRTEGLCTAVFDEPSGTLWFSGMRNGLYKFVPGATDATNITPHDLRALAAEHTSYVASDGSIRLGFIGNRVLRLGDEVNAIHTLPGMVRLARFVPGQRSVIVIFDQPNPTTGAHGLLRLDLDAAGSVTQSTILRVPELASIGTPAALAFEPDRPEIIYVGGTQGIIRVCSDRLLPWTQPPTPLIFSHLEGGPAEQPSSTTLPFSNHRVVLELATAEPALRRTIAFQTRFGSADATWTTASSSDTFEFTNLSEGTYTFAARTVNPAGQTSEPTYFTFTVLPPWYRTGWAYSSYAALILATGLGAMRYREARIRARNAELELLVQQRTSELEVANAAKDEFLASMSHEIRNPMNGVVGLSAAIDTAPLDGEGKHRFDLLRHCAAHLASLLEDILDFSRLQSGRVDLHEQPFSPAELLESVTAITSADSAAVGLPVRVALAPNVPARLVGDARRVRQVLLNFVSNALKYAGRGEIELTAWARPTADQRVELTFAVTDEGPGIPLEEQARVFTKFERGNAARLARIPGTGMGLAVCRTLAERMGGRVWLESEPGRGSTFYLALALPLAATAQPSSSPLSAALEAAEKPVLIVDDEEYNRIALAAMLERHGFVSEHAADGQSALHAAAQRRFDIVFLDYDMPGLKGPELARRLRAQHSVHGQQPLLIATTAYTTVEKRAECLAAGMDSFLGKPITPDRLREAITAALRARHLPGTNHVAIPLEPELPTLADVDHFENIVLLAAQRDRSVEAQFAEFCADCAKEFSALQQQVVRSDASAAARCAHQLAGRFGFVRARDLAEQALDLEQTCRENRWDAAQDAALALAAHWASLREKLSSSLADRVG